MADCFIRVCKNDHISIRVEDFQVAVYLADEILTIAKYIHALRVTAVINLTVRLSFNITVRQSVHTIYLVLY